MKIDGYTRLAAVVANPIRHSISPFIHNTAFEKTGVNGVYLAWEIEPNDLQITVENIRRYQMFGINLSMPYKQAVIPYLDEITREASLIGAVNTVVYQDGMLIGHNTDGKGFFKSLPSFSIQGKKIIVLGAGGAAMAIIAHAALNNAEHITVFTRRASLGEAQQKVAAVATNTQTAISVFSLEEVEILQAKLTHADLLVNATSVGMDGKSLPLSSQLLLPQSLLVADIIYKPFKTPFLKWAQAQGVEIVNGLGMLLYQAAAAFELWTDTRMPTQEIWNLLKEKYQSD